MFIVRYMEVKIMEISSDIKTLFGHTYDVPAGIPAVFDSLEKQFGNFDGYHLYGVTACEGDKLIYRACLASATGSGTNPYNLPDYYIPKGKYLYIILKDWRNHLKEIAGLFDKMMMIDEAKKDTICLEDYRSEDEMLLMVQHK